MRRWWLLLLPVLAIAGALVGMAAAVPLALALAFLVGGAGALVLERAQRRRILTLADEVNEWVGASGHPPVDLGEEAPWRQLAVALNALGAAFVRRGSRLEREQPWRRELVDSIAVPALLFGPDDHLVGANDEARRLFAIPDDEPVTLVQAFGSTVLASVTREARVTGRPVQVDAELSQREVRATASPVGDEVLVLLSDVTEQRRVDEVRRNFVVNASHELKTPVTSIQALTDALELSVGADPTKVEGLVARLSEESERLRRLVHELLDLRRLEERGLLEATPVDLVALIRSVVAEVAGEADKRDIGLEAELPEAAIVVGLEHDLRLMVDNLVRNAIHYNEDGGAVGIRLARSDSGYELEVTDTGIGIPQHDLQRIFERFYRVDVARSRERGGTGLGLSIVRHAIQRHGGSVEVESLLGEGSTFRVRIPIEGA